MAGDIGLFDKGDMGGIGIAGGIIDLFDPSLVQGKAVDDARSGGDDGEIVFALESLKDNFQMEEAEKATAKAKT